MSNKNFEMLNDGSRKTKFKLLLLLLLRIRQPFCLLQINVMSNH